MPLSSVIAEHGALPEPVLRALAAGLATALRAVHAAGFTRGRVGLHTLSLTRDGVRLAEIAIPLPEGEHEEAADPSPETDMSSAPATEQDEDALPTPPSDMSALGVVLACAASGSVRPRSPRISHGREPAAAGDDPAHSSHS
ncbi:hypothetical protein ACWDUL_21405 [Nocardia niigatensis]|uniref:hypothetical protein n=1 Tax=Nocardia niigatensis TaxID=209249 RepID=UPI0012F63978|nr:hypothetical protein [Nocardia niigatensis]